MLLPCYTTLMGRTCSSGPQKQHPVVTARRTHSWLSSTVRASKKSDTVRTVLEATCSARTRESVNKPTVNHYETKLSTTWAQLANITANTITQNIASNAERCFLVYCFMGCSESVFATIDVDRLELVSNVQIECRSITTMEQIPHDTTHESMQ